MHPLLEEIFSTGLTQLPDRSPTKVTSAISRDAVEMIDRTIALCGASSAVEVGMAFGISTLSIAYNVTRLVSIDPHQSDGWHGAGMHLIRRAGLEHVVELIQALSQQALPRLVDAGERFGFALIDGWHTFDHTLVDFFYVDARLESGGIVVIDDVGYPAIDRVIRFILANRDYDTVDAVCYGETVSASLRVRGAIKRWLRTLARTDRDPSPEHEQRFRDIERVQTIALRKRGEDTRRFDHFERF